MAECPGCGGPVDPLRAGHVAILGGRFRYFCRPDCKQLYLQAQGRPAEEDVATARPPEVALVTHDPATVPVPSSRARPKAIPIEVPVASRRDVEARTTLPSPEPAPTGARMASTPDVAPAPAVLPLRPSSATIVVDRTIPGVDVAGIVFGGLVPTLGLLGPAADVARLPLVLASFAALAARFAMARRDLADAHPLVAVGPATAAVVAACWSAAVGDAHAVSIAILAGLTCAAGIAVELAVARTRARAVQSRDALLAKLDVPVRVVRGEQAILAPAFDVRPGEPVVVEAGETVGVDGIVTAGEARVVPWLGAPAEVVKREGDAVVAGARVSTQRLRLTTTWSGRDRAWAKLLVASSARLDVAAPTPHGLRVTIERGTVVAALLLGLAAFGANSTPVQILAAMAAGAVAFGARGLVSLVALHFTRAHIEALGSGITYKDPASFERAGAANVVVLSARGTVLLGEPEIVVIETIGSFEVARVLGLAAGAEGVSAHPFAAAILRAARARGISPDPVRNATAHAGLGVTASSGERLVVGGRAIMLEEKIGVATVDARITELEALGRSVLLVALGDRLVGLIALMDGLRPGARAAVQKLLDARIEPALMSGEARETCETLARALDIEHVRPEVLPADRGPAVRALAEGGSIVAVVGHPQGDDGALGAADVAVAMMAAGSTPGEWAVALASDDVRDAASSLTISHRARERARTAIALGAAPSLIALLAVGFGVAPPAAAPVGILLGVLALVVHAREAPAVA
jgi:cation transport ATPase